ncbi:MAG: glycoside hydrolase family 78 protein [Kiritimatiellaeota bacterium]|nr:glycoside hydrolase family 78 protein [Kiritimatiellota bacterium]
MNTASKSILSILLILSSVAASAAIRVGSLTCEYRVNPLGIDEAEPRLTWKLESSDRGARQTAYHVLVASSEALLKKDRGDLWDSGMVMSGQSVNVVYGGRPLVSRQQCFWKVRVAGADGKASSWSRPALWTMGLLEPGDWQGVWLGKDGEEKTVTALSGCRWVGFPAAGQEGVNDLCESRFYRRVFDIPEGASVTDAVLAMTGDNGFKCYINGAVVLYGADFHKAKVAHVARHLRPGRNVIAVEVENLGDAPNPAGLLGRLDVTLGDGAVLAVATDGKWKGVLAKPESWNTQTFSETGWTTLSFDDSAWGGVKDLGEAGMAPWGAVTYGDERAIPARMLRRDFAAKRGIARATAYFSGLGISELYINGRKVGDHVLSPGLTHYPERTLYVTHDVTGMIKPGKPNAVGIWLGSGRYYAPRLDIPTATLTYGYPKALLQLEIDYTDGTRDTILTDGAWRMTDSGPITANCEYDGEAYDANLEMPGWAEAAFDAPAWSAPQTVAAPGKALRAQMAEPIRVVEDIKPRSVTEAAPGVFIYDMGQNMVGWCRLTVKGPAGTAVSLRHAETLNADGTLYMANIRDAKVTDTYTLKGKGREVYEPRFTYHGFRYVEVTGYPGRPPLSAIEGRVVNDDLPSAGAFACSHPTINATYRNILWGVRGNYRSIPTDCPQRDERQGWLGDRSSESKGETYLYNTATLYTKWLHDMTDAQRDTGSVPDVCPPYWPLYNDGVTWPSSVVIIPGNLYDQYGDRRILERHYPTMAKWLNHMSGFIQDGIITRDTYGDWCVPPEDPTFIHSKDPARKTAPAILATCYLHHCLTLMARYAHALGKPADAQRYLTQAHALRDALNRNHYNKDRGHYDNGSQTSCVLPLAFGITPDAERPRVFNHLVNKIENETRGHVGTGLIGGQWLNRVLTDGGRPDLPYGFATHTDYPSWGYMTEKGATTIWELWNGDTADPAMNSGNHVMLVGDLLIWLYETLAGIAPDPAAPGFKHIIMRPTPVGELTWVKATHNSPYGPIASEWKRDGGRLDWRVTIPPNATATLHIPALGQSDVTERGRPLTKAPGITLLGSGNGRVTIHVGAGSYRFIVTD